MLHKTLFAISLVLFTSISARAAESHATQYQKALDDIRATLGSVPTFAKAVPQESLPGAWQEVKSLMFNSSTALNARAKDLISLAVSSQTPCKFCVIFDRETLKASKASEAEMNEAVQLASITRHWSTFLNGMNYDELAFHREVDQMIRILQDRKDAEKKQAAGSAPDTAAAPVSGPVAITTPQQAYDDIQKTLGMVPTFLRQFPEQNIVGAWLEMKNTQLSPTTSIAVKEKELLGVAVAANIPCRYCVYFHTQAAKLNGASDQEIREAIAVAALDRKWSVIFSGQELDESKFRREAQQMARFVQAHPLPKQMGGQASDSAMGPTEAGVPDMSKSRE